ncbi:hypothetical protein TWF281_004588 [Arthrobotrys megalospora]
MSEQFPDQPIEDTGSPSPRICGVSKRAFWFLFTICILFVIVIGLAAGLGATLGKSNHSSSPAQATTATTSSSATRTTGATTATTTPPPTTTGQWKLQNGPVTFNYTQVSTEGAACAPTGWDQEPIERDDIFGIVTKGTEYYAESRFGSQIGLLSTELIYIPDTNTTSASYVFAFTFPQGQIGRGCNISSGVTSQFVRNGNANALV